MFDCRHLRCRSFIGILIFFDEVLAKIEGFLITALLLFILLFSFVQVVLKLLPGNLGIQWLEMLLRYLVPWIGLLGGSLATRSARHIKIDLLTKLVPQSTRKWLNAALTLFSMIVTAVLVYVAARYFLDDMKTGVTSFIFDSFGVSKDVPRWIFSSILPIAYFLVFWHLLVSLVNLFCVDKTVEGEGK